MGVRSIPAEGERGSIRSLIRLFLMAGSGFIGADTANLLSLDPMTLITVDWLTGNENRIRLQPQQK